MKISRQDDQYLVIENKPYLIRSALAFSTVMILEVFAVIIANYGGFEYVPADQLYMFVGLVVASLAMMGIQPTISVCFNRPKRLLVVRRTWYGKFRRQASYALDQVEDVSLVDFKQQGIVYQLKAWIKPGKPELLLAEATGNLAGLHRLAAQIEEFLAPLKSGVRVNADVAPQNRVRLGAFKASLGISVTVFACQLVLMALWVPSLYQSGLEMREYDARQLAEEQRDEEQGRTDE